MSKADSGRSKKSRRFASGKSHREDQPRRENSKQAKLIAMLRRPDGATVDQMAKAFGWQNHTVRGVLSGVLKKKLGLEIVSTNAEGGRVYRIA